MTAIEPIQINLFFVANQASHKFDELKHDSNVNVSFYDQKTTGWASISGIARVSHDKELIKKFWSPMLSVCSPGDAVTDNWDRISSFFGDLKDGKHDGTKNDPRVCLIEVVPNEIRYWVSTSSSISRTAKIAYGALSGNAKIPGEFRIISDDEVCPRSYLNVHLLVLSSILVDSTCPGSQQVKVVTVI